MKSHIINVFDSEWTCYADGIFPPGEMPEPIEFGITLVDLKKRAIVRRLCIPIFPVKSQISSFCTELTGWTKDKLKKQGGVSLSEACRRVAEKYGGQNRLLVIDTDGEIPELKAHCDKNAVAFPFGGSTFNVSTFFALLTGEKANLGLEAMLLKLGCHFEGSRHFAYDDSYNIARLFLELLERSSFTLPELGSAERIK